MQFSGRKNGKHVSISKCIVFISNFRYDNLNDKKFDFVIFIFQHYNEHIMVT